MLFKMSSAIRFNLDQCKVLSSGNGLKEQLVLKIKTISECIIHLIWPIRNCARSTFKPYKFTNNVPRMVGE